MENLFLKHHEIKNQIRQIITNEYQENHDFACIPSENPSSDVTNIKADICKKFNEIRPDEIKLEKYIYIIPDVRNQRVVIKF
jgi:CRISPR/Cas system endoribonuclease Cas6 (RAMP superfamily)